MSSAKKSKIDIDDKAINTIRVLAADIVQKSQSGHPGAPMGCAPMAHALFSKVMNFSPSNPGWWARDRFVLSNGHACALQYIMLHLCGFGVTVDHLKDFRQLDSMTPGHPENFVTPGVEVSTGPLGQGISNAVGMAIAEKHLAATFNKPDCKIVDNYTYVICGDGCMQEGVASEACALGGHLGLGKLIVLYDDNSITIDGDTAISFTEDVVKRFEAYGWHTQTVSDVTDAAALMKAIENAKAETGKPSIIKTKTIIGHGSLKQGDEKTHGAPLGAADVAHVKTTFGFDPAESFVVPADVSTMYAGVQKQGAGKEKKFDALFQAYESKYPDLAKELKRRMAGELPAGWKDKLPKFTTADKAQGSRKYSHMAINAIADAVPELMGGSADLTGSNNTNFTSGVFQKDTPEGRQMRFGVREHGMSSVMNGMFAYGGLRPFGATFLNFITYAWGGVRLSALSRFGLIYVMTHDSIGLGEDGPTHQPVEVMELMRSTPNMMAFRPADGNEVTGAYICAMEAATTPSVLALSRQNCPHLEGSSAEVVAKGAYALCEHGPGSAPDIILAATGSEVHICVDVAKALAAAGTRARVVSMPCWELFEDQDEAYQLSVFPEGSPVMSVEAMGVQGWQRWAHAPFGMARFGASAPYKAIYEKFGFTVENLTKQASLARSCLLMKVVEFYKANGGAQSLVKRVDLNLTGYAGGH
ncbi:unnamed protein product [Pylaiella littoralis]